MMTALFVWMGVSAFATSGIVAALSLGARRHIPTIETEPETGPLMILNRGAGEGNANLATSYAQ